MGRGAASQARRNARRVKCPACDQEINDDCKDEYGRWCIWPHASRVVAERDESHKRRHSEQIER